MIRFLVLFAVIQFYNTTKLVSKDPLKSTFVDLILQLQFTSAANTARRLDEEATLPLFSYITQLNKHAGQFPDLDSLVFKNISDHPDSTKLHIHDLIKGTYLLYNHPSKAQSYEYLTNAIRISKLESDIDILKLSYLSILNSINKCNF